MIPVLNRNTTIVRPIRMKERAWFGTINDEMLSMNYGNDYVQVTIPFVGNRNKTYARFAPPPDRTVYNVINFNAIPGSSLLSAMKINEIYLSYLSELSKIVDTHDFLDLIFYFGYDYGIGWQRYRIVTKTSHSSHDYSSVIIKFDNELDALQYKLSI